MNAETSNDTTAAATARTAARPIRLGCIGVSGYPSQLIRQLDRHIPLDRARLAAVDDSLSSPSDETAEILQRHAAASVAGVDKLVERDDLDALIVGTSIDSHRPFTEMALERGLHVHCEKPVAAAVQDAYAMIEARDRARRTVLIGFQDTYGDSAQWAKRKILEGAIGRVRRVRLRACWPRPDRYYQRNAWAGRIEREGRWVLDSPAHNALSHQINLALYVTGPTAGESNRATALEAELYRAREIENYDTCAFRAETEAGCDLLVLLTHACAGTVHPVIEYEGEKGLIRRRHPNYFELERDGQVVESQKDGEKGTHGAMFENLLDCIEGLAERPRCAIENGLEVTRLVNAGSEATPVHRVPEEAVRRVARDADVEDDELETVSAIDGIEPLFERCFERFALPSELGDVDWARSPGKIDMRGYDRFNGPAES